MSSPMQPLMQAIRLKAVRLALSAALLIIAGCGPLIPARTPVQLDHTPGPPISIDERDIIGQRWRVAYPPGWKIVRINTAAEPLRLVFVSPDENPPDETSDENPESAIVITLSEAPFPDAQRLQRGWLLIYVHSTGPSERSAERLAALRGVLASLRPANG